MHMQSLGRVGYTLHLQFFRLGSAMHSPVIYHAIACYLITMHLPCGSPCARVVYHALAPNLPCARPSFYHALASHSPCARFYFTMRSPLL